MCIFYLEKTPIDECASDWYGAHSWEAGYVETTMFFCRPDASATKWQTDVLVDPFVCPINCRKKNKMWDYLRPQCYCSSYASATKWQTDVFVDPFVCSINCKEKNKRLRLSGTMMLFYRPDSDATKWQTDVLVDPFVCPINCKENNKSLRLSGTMMLICWPDARRYRVAD